MDKLNIINESIILIANAMNEQTKIPYLSDINDIINEPNISAINIDNVYQPN